MRTSNKDQSVIIASMVAVLILGYINSIIVPRKTPRLRLLIGVGILYFILATVAQVNSKIAKNFSLLVLLTAFLAEGGGALNWLLGRGSHDSLGLSGTGTPNIPPITGGPSQSTTIVPSSVLGPIQPPTNSVVTQSGPRTIGGNVVGLFVPKGTRVLGASGPDVTIVPSP